MRKLIVALLLITTTTTLLGREQILSHYKLWAIREAASNIKATDYIWPDYTARLGFTKKFRKNSIGWERDGIVHGCVGNLDAGESLIFFTKRSGSGDAGMLLFVTDLYECKLLAAAIVDENGRAQTVSRNAVWQRCVAELELWRNIKRVWEFESSKPVVIETDNWRP